MVYTRYIHIYGIYMNFITSMFVVQSQEQRWPIFVTATPHLISLKEYYQLRHTHLIGVYAVSICFRLIEPVVPYMYMFRERKRHEYLDRRV